MFINRSIYSDSEHAVSAITAARLLREGHRRVDVLVQRVRISLAHGIRRSEQLHGAGCHQGDEGLLGRRSEGSHRRVQSTSHLNFLKFPIFPKPNYSNQLIPSSYKRVRQSRMFLVFLNVFFFFLWQPQN